MLAAKSVSSEATDVESLVRRGLPLVQYAVSDMAARIPRHVQRDELVSAGMLGLTQAARSWDPERGVTFERYARTRIQGALLDELRSRDWATRSVRAGARRLSAASEELASQGHEPTVDRLASNLGMDPAAVAKLNDDVHRATVLHYDAEFTDVNDVPVRSGDVDEPAECLLDREMIAYLRDAVVTLPDRLRKVVVEYFFEERQMQDIADDLGVTESRVSQMRGEAVKLLRTALAALLDTEPVAELIPESPRASRRTTAYLAEVAAASTYASRLSSAGASVAQRAALA